MFQPVKYFSFALSAIFFSCAEHHTEIPDGGKDFCSSIHRNDSLSLTKELEPVAELMKTKTGVYVLEDGGNSLVTRAWLCEYAEKTIDIQYFIFSTDNVGLIACDYLIRAADRGVKVRILVDDIMVEAGVHEILSLDSHENIEIKIYNPGCNLGKSIFGKLKSLAKDAEGFNQRMHNKTFTVDGKVVITGGRNIADEYFDYDHEFNFRDRDVLFLGKAVTSVQTSFEKFWNDSISVPVTDIVEDKEDDFSSPSRYELLHQYACDPKNFWPQVRERIQNLPKTFKHIRESNGLVWTDSLTFISDDPGKNRDRRLGGITTDSLISLVKQAKTSIDIQSPYLIVTDLGLNLFRETVKRGVKVRIMTNSLLSNDNLGAFAGYQGCRKQLLEAGVRIFEFKPDAAERYRIMTGELQEKLKFTPVFGIHAKSMVIDGKTTVIGTFNLDPRSANLNTECITVIHSQKVSQGVLSGMEEEYKPENSWETTLTFNPDDKADKKVRVKTWLHKALPKEIL
jgi:phosphatidylserine/phosphatidylglycerophosphate/cardiolipin synthase-like enzyme